MWPRCRSAAAMAFASATTCFVCLSYKYGIRADSHNAAFASSQVTR